MSPRAAALVAGLISAAWVASRDPTFLSLPSVYVGYQPTDALDVQLIEPVLHAPWIGTVSWIFAALLTVCLVSEVWLLAMASGATTPAAVAVVIAMVVSASWIDIVRHGGPLAVALAFSWLAWMFVLASRAGGIKRPLAGIACWAAAIAASWVALAIGPVVIAGLTVGLRRKRIRLALVVASVAGALAGLALYCLRIASATSALTAHELASVSAFDVLITIFDHVVRPNGPFGEGLGASQLLAMALAIAGVAGARLRKRWRIGVVVSGAVIAGVAVVWPLWSSAIIWFGVWLASPFVAVGLTLLARAVAPRWRTLATAVAGAAFCVASGTGAFTASERVDVASRDGLAPLLGSLAVDSARFVVEARDVDAAVIASHGARGQWRIARDPAYVAEAADLGDTVLVGAVGRRHLELSGFRFQRLSSENGGDGFGVSRVTGQLHCAVVRTDRWSLLPGLEYTGRLGVEIPSGFGGSMTLIVGDDSRPRLAVADVNGDERPVKIEPLLTAPSVDTPPPDYWFDGGDPARAPGQVFRVTLAGRPGVPLLLDIGLGRRAPRVLARLTGFETSARGRVCAAPLAAPELWSDPESPAEAVLPLTLASMLTTGWYGVEGPPAAAAYRWTDSVAVVLVPSARRTSVRIAVDAEAAVSAGAGEPPALRLSVNGVEQPAQLMREGSARYEWTISARGWLAGTNELLFGVSRVRRPADAGERDTRMLGMKVTRLAVTRRDP